MMFERSTYKPALVCSFTDVWGVKGSFSTEVEVHSYLSLMGFLEHFSASTLNICTFTHRSAFVGSVCDVEMKRLNQLVVLETHNIRGVDDLQLD